MNYNTCQFLNEYLPSVDNANITKKGHSSVYQQQTSPSLSLSSSSSSSPSSSSSSAQEIKFQRIEQNTTSTVSTIDHFYSTNRTNTNSYYPPVSDTTRVNIRNTTLSSIDYNSHIYYFLSTHRSIIQQCSDTFFLLTGYSPLELIGKSLADFLHPDDLYHFGHQAGATFPFIRFFKKNGQTLTLECKKVTNFTQDEIIYAGMLNAPSKPSSSSFGPDMTNPINVNAELQISSSCCMNSAAIKSTSSNNFYKTHRDILLRNYVCVDCGVTNSPEWRKGPHGPKTLCNACGLRWAKKNKRK